jgi:hypothetical protein
MVPVGTVVREVIGIDQKSDNRQDFTVRFVEDLKVGFHQLFEAYIFSGT